MAFFIHLNNIFNIWFIYFGQVLSSPVHLLSADVSAVDGGPIGQLWGYPHEFPHLCSNQTPANQSHAEKTVQGDHDAAGTSLCVYGL